ncbi:MAG: barstar family protein [Phycisphaeraceae bacterium]|nr:barstar family protein [Phycisphaeraceae bacterium]
MGGQSLVLVVECTRAGRVNEMHDELARALRLPEYYGRNLNALWDCITDVGWYDYLPLCVVLMDADQFLVAEPMENMLTELFERAGQYWATGHNENEVFEPPTPFHCVLNYPNSVAVDVSALVPHELVIR